MRTHRLCGGVAEADPVDILEIVQNPAQNMACLGSTKAGGLRLGRGGSAQWRPTRGEEVSQVDTRGPPYPSWLKGLKSKSCDHILDFPVLKVGKPTKCALRVLHFTVCFEKMQTVCPSWEKRRKLRS